MKAKAHDITNEFTGYLSVQHLVTYQPVGRGFDDSSKSLLDFKEDIKSAVQHWVSLSADSLGGHLSCDIVVRALGSQELKSDGKQPLDKLGAGIAQRLGATYRPDLLKKTKIGRKLVGLGAAERAKELEGKYEFHCAGLKANSVILVVDDIVTAGTTLRAIRDAIKAKLPDATLHFFALGRTA